MLTRNACNTSLLVSILMLLAGCLSNVDYVTPGTKPDPVGDALAVLDQTCGATRPNFAGIEKRMRKLGLVPLYTENGEVPDGVGYVSLEQQIGVRVYETSDGHDICWVNSLFAGDLVQLQDAIAKRYGGARRDSNFAQFGSVPLLQYDRGPRGKMLIDFLGRAQQGKSPTRYRIGIPAGGL